MTKFSAAISNEQSIHAALELSKNSWLLAIQVPGRDNPSLHPLKGGDAEGLMAKLGAAWIDCSLVYIRRRYLLGDMNDYGNLWGYSPMEIVRD